MKEELVVRLNTEENLVTAQNPDMAGLYTRMEEESETYRRGDFKRLIKYCIETNKESAIEEDRTLAGEIRSLMNQHSHDSPFEIMVYDENKQLKKNAANGRSTTMHLEDVIAPYIDRRDLEGNGELKNYLDVVVRLNAAAGRW